MNGAVVPLHPQDAQRAAAPDAVEIEVAAPFLHFPAGRYTAVSVTWARQQAFKRASLVFWFDLYPLGALPEKGARFGRVPCHFRLPTRRLAASSKLARWFAIANVPVRGRRLPVSLLCNRVWTVEVRDVVRDGEGRPLHERTVYSVVAHVVEPA